MRGIFTIGYEGARIEDFVATLRSVGVETVLDVRELPISRRKGFSKSALTAHLEAGGIKYRHEKRLGSPSHIRNQLRETGDYKRYFKDFNGYLATQSDFVAELAGLLKGKVALVCYERNPDECHRKSVAELMSTFTKLKPKHIGVQAGDSDGADKKAGLRSGKGVPAA